MSPGQRDRTVVRATSTPPTWAHHRGHGVRVLEEGVPVGVGEIDARRVCDRRGRAVPMAHVGVARTAAANAATARRRPKCFDLLVMVFMSSGYRMRTLNDTSLPSPGWSGRSKPNATSCSSPPAPARSPARPSRSWRVTVAGNACQVLPPSRLPRSRSRPWRASRARGSSPRGSGPRCAAHRGAGAGVARVQRVDDGVARGRLGRWLPLHGLLARGVDPDDFLVAWMVTSIFAPKPGPAAPIAATSSAAISPDKPLLLTLIMLPLSLPDVAAHRTGRLKRRRAEPPGPAATS